MLFEAPFIHQLEALPLISGYEVTTLAMLLNYYAIDIDKNTLTERIDHVPLVISSTTLIHSGVIVDFNSKNIYIKDPIYSKKAAPVKFILLEVNRRCFFILSHFH